MPVTKKKGAVFAIFADSPVATSKTTTTTTKPNKSNTSDSKSVPSSSSTSKHPPPMKSGLSIGPNSGKEGHQSINLNIPRKALSNIQPSAVKGFPRLGGGDKKVSGLNDPEGKEMTKDDKLQDLPLQRALIPEKSPQPNFTSNKRPPPLKSAPSKRQLEIFSDHHRETLSPASSSSPVATVNKADQCTSLAAAQSTSTLESPIKKGRLTPRKVDKENISPSINSNSDPNSPASRTRSKTRQPPLQPVPSPSMNSTTSSSISHQSSEPLKPHGGGTALPVDPRYSFSHGERDVEIAALVGSGRGALSLKKGRRLAVLLDQSGRDDEGDASGLEDHGEDNRSGTIKGNTMVAGKDGKKLSKMTKTKTTTGTRTIFADGALADVSEAYGAFGSEPEGFRR